MDESPLTASQWEAELARLRAELQALRAQLEESEETLLAIREGHVDALVVSTPAGERLFTLHGGEHPYRALIEQMREGAATLTPQGVIHYCNGCFAEMLKLPLEQVMGGRIEDFVAPADRALLSAMLSAGRGRAELALTASDATELSTLVSAISLRDEGPAAICLVVADLTEHKRHEARIEQLNVELEERVVERTAQLAAANRKLEGEVEERKQAEESLRQSEERLRLALDAANSGAWEWNLSTNENTWSEQLWTLYGVELHSCQPSYEAWRQVIHSEDRAKAERVMQQAARDGTEMNVEFRVLDRDGTERWLVALGRPLRDAAGQVARFIGIVLDVTERKQAEKALQAANEQLAQAANRAAKLATAAEVANRAKSQFLANMSHEIRTPMTAILGYADLLLEESVSCATQEHVAVIKRSGEQLLSLINDILDLSKVEAGKLQIAPIRCSPGKLVAEIVSFMRVRAAEKQLNLQTELAGPLPATVLTDPLRLRQVLINLLGNAIKFPDHGEIRLTVRLTGEGGPPRLGFDVTDTGIGMNAEQIGQLFQPFTQVDSSAARKFRGTGLGLCISKHLAKALGGDIEVCSEPGQGSTFSVTIDPGPLDGVRLLSEGVEAVLQPPARAAPPAAGQVVLHGRILLAEDSLDSQRLLAMLLRRAGAEVTVVENGQLAVAAAWAAYEAGRPFDAILMDMSMPVLDGFEATRQLRQRGYTAPIVALTAYAMTEDFQKCLDAGCNDYATKPIDQPRLLATVAPWAARGCTPDAAPAATRPASTTRLPTLIYSDLDFADNPELGELVDFFVEEMPDRIKALEAQAQSRDWNGLARAAHGLRGAAGSYGFGEITSYAARLEAAVQEAQSEERMLTAVEELVNLCRCIRTGNPDTGEHRTS